MKIATRIHQYALGYWYRCYHNNKAIRLIKRSLSSQSAMCRGFLLWKYLVDADSLGQPPLQQIMKTQAAENNTCGSQPEHLRFWWNYELCLLKHDLCCPWIIAQRRNITRPVSEGDAAIWLLQGTDCSFAWAEDWNHHLCAMLSAHTHTHRVPLDVVSVHTCPMYTIRPSMCKRHCKMIAQEDPN